jgi:hypothetical protein
MPAFWSLDTSPAGIRGKFTLPPLEGEGRLSCVCAHLCRTSHAGRRCPIPEPLDSQSASTGSEHFEPPLPPGVHQYNPTESIAKAQHDRGTSPYGSVAMSSGHWLLSLNSEPVASRSISFTRVTGPPKVTVLAALPGRDHIRRASSYLEHRWVRL